MFIIVIQDGLPTLYGPYPDFATARNVCNSYLFCFADVREPDEWVQMSGFKIGVTHATSPLYPDVEQPAVVESHIHEWNHNTGRCTICGVGQSEVLGIKPVGPKP